MRRPRQSGQSQGGALLSRALGVAVAACVSMFVYSTVSASAAAPPAGDQPCLACHATPGLQKKLANGETLSLTIQPDHFAPSVHSALGCTACHAAINLATHPSASNDIASKSVFSTAMVQVCRTCHASEFEQWDQSVHASLVRQGNTVAPICTSCHAPHAMLKGAAAAIETVPCQACHAAIFTAYSTSIHGLLRGGGVTQAPLCFNCHGAHDVAVPSAGTGRRDVCLGCHSEAIESHRTWLPNVDLHFSVVSCPVCHTPQAQRVVNLSLYNSATQKEIAEPQGIPRFEGMGASLAATKPGLDQTTLLTLLRTLNSQAVGGRTAIRGRLEVRTGIEDHQLTVASQAIADCATCHQQGSAAFQSVEVSVAGPSGIPIRYAANKDVLSSGFSIESVGGFYAIGGTRITLLDVLFVLALLGGVGWSFAHMAARWTFRRFINPTQGEPGKGR